ncbi:hypothetical protein E6R18_24840 [Streptomyces sp. A1277]|nr:hypothetical protein E6R18_24840 [Streptomyces sp. A1277]
MQLSLGHTWTNRHRFTVVGPATQLQNAFSSGTPVTLTGEDCTGDRVYLGVTRQTYGDMGVTMETLGLDAHLGEDASYLIDTQRLAEAPQLAAIIASEQARADQIDAEVAAQDDRYLDSDYE